MNDQPQGQKAADVAQQSELGDTKKLSKGVIGNPVPVDASSVALELAYIWAGHTAVGLKGKMCLYTLDGQDPFRAEQEGLRFWFGPDDTDLVIEKLNEYYNDGSLPNSPLLLNPIVHKVKEDGTAKPLGSGIMWCTALALGIYRLDDDAMERIRELGVFYSPIERGDNKKAGLKIFAYADRVCWPMADGLSLETNEAFYDLVNLDAPSYYPYYMLSGVRYLTLHGLFHHPNAALLIPTMGETLPAVIKEGGEVDMSKDTARYSFAHDSKNMQDYVAKYQKDPQEVLDARFCWDSYDREHALYMKWGRDPKDVPHNNRFYNLCARDVMLFDATGPMRKTGGDQQFEFLVPGLIPRGAICILAASGGTGKSSVAHELCIHCAIDYKQGEPRPFWLGQPVNVDAAKDGICVYFSGEDGPAIINARADLYDPEKRAQRLQFHRADFGGEDVSFAEFVEKRLMKMPNIPLIVVDPARKYLSGDEEDSEVVNEFFHVLEELAMTKNASVVVVHHLKRGAKPKSIPEVLDELRGSQVFIDRARVVLGMFREGKHTIVGLAKNNIPPSLGMVTEERVFVRNPKTLKLMWVPGEEGRRADTLTQEELDQMEYESFMQQVEAAKTGGLVDNADDYVPPSLR